MYAIQLSLLNKFYLMDGRAKPQLCNQVQNFQSNCVVWYYEQANFATTSCQIGFFSDIILCLGSTTHSLPVCQSLQSANLMSALLSLLALFH